MSNCCGNQMFGLYDGPMGPGSGDGLAVVGTPPGNPDGNSGIGANNPGQSGSTGGFYLNTGKPIDPNVETWKQNNQISLDISNAPATATIDTTGRAVFNPGAANMDPSQVVDPFATGFDIKAFWEKYKWWIVGGGLVCIGGVVYAVKN